MKLASTRKLFFIMACAALFAASTFNARSAQTDRAALLADLPPNTLIAVYVPDVPWLLRQWEASPFYHFYQDPGAAGFFAPLQSQVAHLRGEMTQQKGVDPAALERFFDGGLVMAGIATPPGSPSPVEWVLVFNHNGDPAIIDRFKKMEVDPGVSVERTPATHAGRAYTQIKIVQEEAAAADTPAKVKEPKRLKIPKNTSGGKDKPDLSLGNMPGVKKSDVKRQVTETYDDYFGETIAIHAGSVGQPIEAILDRLNAPAPNPGASAASSLPSFADWARATALRDEGRGPGDVEVYADVNALVHAWGAPGKGDALFSFMKGLRLEEVQSAALAARFSEGKLAVELALRAPEPRKGVSRLLFAAHKPPVQAAALVPPQVLLYDATSYPIADVWALARQTLHTAFPAIDVLLGAQFEKITQDSGISIERDILAHLGPDLIHFSLPLTESGPVHSELTVMLAADGATSLGQSLDRLLGYTSQAYGAFYSTRTKTKDRVLWQVFTGRAETQLGPASPPLLNLCLTPHWLIISPGRVGMEAVLARLDGAREPSLADVPEFKRVMAGLPPGRVQEAFTNLTALGSLLSSGISAASAVGVKAPATSATGAALSEVNLHAIPAPDVLQKYFGPFGAARQVTNDQMRVTMELFYAKP